MNPDDDSHYSLLIAAYGAYEVGHLRALPFVGDVENQGTSCSMFNAVSIATEQVACPVTPLIFVSPRLVCKEQAWGSLHQLFMKGIEFHVELGLRQLLRLLQKIAAETPGR